MRFIQSFENATAIQEAVDNGNLGKPYVAYDEENQVIDWNTKGGDKDYSSMYLTFEITGDGEIKHRATQAWVEKKVEYRKNGGEWTEIRFPYYSINSISVTKGDVVEYRGNNSAYGESESYCVTFSGTTAQFNVYGNIMSLIDSTNFETLDSLTDDYTFNGLFRSCIGLTDVSNLVLPATTLANFCYYNMFNGCTSITTAPELPATKLVYYCYAGMFQGCTSLNYIKCLATVGTKTSTTISSWVDGVASVGTFVKAAGVDWYLGKIYGIPSGWTVEEV